MRRLAPSLSILPGLLAASLVAACGGRERAPEPAYSPQMLAHASYKVVLVAGDSSDVFDNATGALQQWLIKRGVAAADIRRLGASRLDAVKGLEVATAQRVTAAIAGLAASDGRACLVFITSDGASRLGLELGRSGRYLDPLALDAALVRGCGRAPTVVIASGDYSGVFAHYPMTRDNRIVLTATSDGQPRFGLVRSFNVYDGCLLDALDKAPTWQAAYGAVTECVSRREAADGVEHSRPQARFGPAVAEMPLPRLRP